MEKKILALPRFLLIVVSISLFSLPSVAQQTSAPGHLQQAGVGVQTLQSWYTQNTGLYQTTGWWNSANAVTLLANYSLVSGSKEYAPVFANTFQQAQKEASGFLNKYYDDEGWWALGWIGAFDVTGEQRYLGMARSIFADMAAGWDQTCGGGIWWSKDKNYKNAIANELFLSVAANLALRAGDRKQKAEYVTWAKREWSWFSHTGMINGENLVNDGLDLSTCKNNGKNTWTYNQGVILGGLIALNKVAPDSSLPATAKAIANAAMGKLTDSNGVLHDTCEPKCDGDAVQFKGIFVRNLMALNDAFPDAKYRSFVETNANSIWQKTQGPNHQFGLIWSGPFDSGNAASQTSALDALVAAAKVERHK